MVDRSLSRIRMVDLLRIAQRRLIVSRLAPHKVELDGVLGGVHHR
jgi:hypothetical protein